jgi:hypothetical protein
VVRISCSVFDQPHREALAMLFLDLHRYGYIIGWIFGLWLFPFGLLVYRSGFLPRIAQQRVVGNRDERRVRRGHEWMPEPVEAVGQALEFARCDGWPDLRRLAAMPAPDTERRGSQSAHDCSFIFQEWGWCRQIVKGCFWFRVAAEYGTSQSSRSKRRIPLDNHIEPSVTFRNYSKVS